MPKIRTMRPFKPSAMLKKPKNYEWVNHPSHYGGDTVYEAIKVIDAWGLNFCLGTAVRYISRLGKKPGEAVVKDLKKARWYIDHEIQRLEWQQVHERPTRKPRKHKTIKVRRNWKPA